MSKPYSHAKSECKESSHPALALIFLIIAVPEQGLGILSFFLRRKFFDFKAHEIYIPSFCPGVGEVDDENQLDEDKEEATNHAKIHQQL